MLSCFPHTALVPWCSVNVLSCFPPGRSDLPLSYFSRFLFSDAYLQRVDPTLGEPLLLPVPGSRCLLPPLPLLPCPLAGTAPADSTSRQHPAESTCRQNQQTDRQHAVAAHSSSAQQQHTAPLPLPIRPPSPRLTGCRMHMTRRLLPPLPFSSSPPPSALHVQCHGHGSWYYKGLCLAPTPQAMALP